MAVQKGNITSKLSIQVVTGFDNGGDPVTAKRSITGINPDVDNDVLLNVAKKLGAIQQHSVTGYIRTDSCELIENAGE